MVDVHTRHTVYGAIELGRRLQALDVYWLESPIVPEDVPGQAEIAAALEHWLHSAPVDLNNWHTINSDIDPGEASSICLAERYPNSLLVIDDKAGRVEAQARGLRYIGLAGVLRRAKQVGLIDDVRPLLEALRGAGYFLSDAIMREILRSVGEEE